MKGREAAAVPWSLSPFGSALRSGMQSVCKAAVLWLALVVYIAEGRIEAASEQLCGCMLSRLHAAGGKAGTRGCKNGIWLSPWMHAEKSAEVTPVLQLLQIAAGQLLLSLLPHRRACSHGKLPVGMHVPIGCL